MDEFLKNATSASWWLSAVVVGVLINLVSALLIRGMDTAGITFSSWMRKRSERKREAFSLSVEFLVRNPRRLQAAYAREARWRARGIHAIAFGILGWILLSNSGALTSHPWAATIAGTMLALLFLMSSLCQSTADDVEEKTSEAQRRLDAVERKKQTGVEQTSKVS